MTSQNYIVMLSDDAAESRQVFLGVDSLGVLRYATRPEAFQFASVVHAQNALDAERERNNWPNAKILVASSGEGSK